jgi:cystathionine beta-lyase/cystathionine gamma-synthase
MGFDLSPSLVFASGMAAISTTLWQFQNISDTSVDDLREQWR